MKKKFKKIVSLVMLGTGFTTPLASAKDVCVLTYNSNIWESLPMEVAERFLGFQWKAEGIGYNAGAVDGLKLWGQDVLMAKVSGQSNTTSLDVLIYDDRASKGWVKKEKVPFAIVLPSDKARCGLQKFASRGVPHYKLIDKSGKVLAVGYEASKKKIKTL